MEVLFFVLVLGIVPLAARELGRTGVARHRRGMSVADIRHRPAGETCRVAAPMSGW